MDAKRASEARVAGYGVPLGEQFPDLTRCCHSQTPGTDTRQWVGKLTRRASPKLLVRIKGEYTDLPIYITENGAAFDDYVDPNGHVLDHDRISYLCEHVSAVHDAIDANVNVQGYFVWSLLDNFEWSFGYSRRFGIVWVDFPTGTRLPKASFWWYQRVVQANALEP